MSSISEQRATLRQEFESTLQRPPVDLKVFRELMGRAPPSAWLAMAQSTPIASGQASSGRGNATESASAWFGLYLVDPSSVVVEVLGKVRGGPRTWTNLDSLSNFVEALLDATGLKGRICVHVI